jgi:predicted TIM-barrel fold metal-dependent hydrolase
MMTRQIIDCHTHVINQREPVWGWGPSFTVERLIETMDRDYDVMGETRHVDKAIIMTGLGLTSLDDHTIEEAYAYPFEGIAKYPDRLFFNPVINPRTWVPDGLSKIEGWADEHNIVMLKIHPSMHNYHLPGAAPYPNENDAKMIYPIFELARSMDVPVMIHMGETPYAVPANIAPLAQAFPDVPMICAHSGANNIPGNALDALLLARTYENIYLGNTWVQPQDWNQIYYGIGASRMVLESDCSPLSMGQQLRLVTNLHLPPPLGVGASEDEVYQVIGGNIAQLCHLDG